MAIKTASHIISSMLLLTLVGCSSMEQPTKSTLTDKPLYERLGGKSAITAVVEDFVGRVAAATTGSTANSPTQIFPV